jgi:hypothetical protein
MLLMRSGFTAYYDLQDDSGVRHFAGQRPGCWINTIAADGLALIPEASAGCICLFQITCSLALEPRADHYRWGIYSAGGSNTPVRHLAVNLGGPGDMRDAEGTLWLGYPRPSLPSDRDAMGLALDMQVEFETGGGYLDHETEARTIAGTDPRQIDASYARGLKRCILPLRGDTDGPAEYIIRLHFPLPEDLPANQTGFDIKLQGTTVTKGFDPKQAAEGPHRSASLEFPGIRVDRNLEIELVCRDDAGEPAPVLSGLEVLCTNEVETAPGAVAHAP